MNLSVLMSIYDRERPESLRQSLKGLAEQSIKASQVVIVKDGPLSKELEDVLASFHSALPITYVQLAENVGLGPALAAGLQACQNELVARVDSDDISLTCRFEKQLAVLEEHPGVAAVGAAIGEFVDDPKIISAVRRPPCEGLKLTKFAKFRNPLNHMTVMFRKSAVMAAGGYRHFPGLEDYDLWVRMLMRSMELRNLPEILVLARCGAGMARRRGGFHYMRSELRLYRHFLDIGFISVPEFALNLLMRAPVRMMPTPLRRLSYRTILRQEGSL